MFLDAIASLEPDMGVSHAVTHNVKKIWAHIEKLGHIGNLGHLKHRKTWTH